MSDRKNYMRKYYELNQNKILENRIEKYDPNYFKNYVEKNKKVIKTYRHKYYKNHKKNSFLNVENTKSKMSDLLFDMI